MNSLSCFLAIPFTKSIMSSLTGVQDSRLQVDLLGNRFANPVGLAAGFDKDARWFRQLSTLGFSHIEVGTLTGQPQQGNPKKRLFRLPQDRALLNCMGFNNRGSEAAQLSLQKIYSGPKQKSNQKKDCVLGINIGLSKTVAVQISELAQRPGGNDKQGLDLAIEDYLLSFRRMHSYADYITINVSSPNTQGLRDLQHPDKIGELIRAIRTENDGLVKEGQDRKPIFVKVAPDLSEADLDQTLEALIREKVDGLIATNTTISDERLKTDKTTIQSQRCQCPSPGGGFSGRPLTDVSREFVASVYRKTNGELPIIGVGGIMTGEDAWRMLAAGASIVQVYTGFIYGGPLFVKNLNRYLLRRMEREGLESISQLTGTEAS